MQVRLVCWLGCVAFHIWLYDRALQRDPRCQSVATTEAVVDCGGPVCSACPANPRPSISSASGDTATSSPFTITITFTEAVSGLQSSDIVATQTLALEAPGPALPPKFTAPQGVEVLSVSTADGTAAPATTWVAIVNVTNPAFESVVEFFVGAATGSVSPANDASREAFMMGYSPTRNVCVSRMRECGVGTRAERCESFSDGTSRCVCKHGFFGDLCSDTCPTGWFAHDYGDDHMCVKLIAQPLTQSSAAFACTRGVRNGGLAAPQTSAELSSTLALCRMGDMGDCWIAATDASTEGEWEYSRETSAAYHLKRYPVNIFPPNFWVRAWLRCSRPRSA